MTSQERILIIEDNEDNRIIYRTMLEFGGYEVLEAADGHSGVEIARAELPDVILMDISLPILDGWEATRLLKAGESTRTIPIIALTAHALAADRARAFEVGCDAYMSKPIEPRAVLDEVRRWVKHVRARAAADT